MRYLQARRNREIIQRSYQYYVTNSLRLIPQMMYLSDTWQSVVDGVHVVERTAEEIIDDIASRLEA